MRNNIIFFLALIFIYSCSTDLDVNAEWEDIPVVFCVLDPSQDLQFAKVNKTFLGDAPASVMAQESDSLFFDKVQVFLYEYAGTSTGSPINVIEFDETDTISKDDGYFANDVNILYVTDFQLSQSNSYQLEIIIDDGRKVVTSDIIQLIEGARISFPNPNIQFINLANYGATSRFEYYPGTNTKVSQMTMRFNYIEVDSNGDTTSNFLRWTHPIHVTTDITDNTSPINRTFEIESFYLFLKNNLDAPEEGVERFVKMPVSLQYKLAIANEDYRTYMEISAPSQGIVQDKPSFTNLENALGLFAARYNVIHNIKLGQITLDSLSRGIYTKDLGFQDRNSNYYSPFF